MDVEQVYVRRVGTKLVIGKVNVDVPIMVVTSHVGSRREGK